MSSVMGRERGRDLGWKGLVAVGVALCAVGVAGCDSTTGGKGLPNPKLYVGTTFFASAFVGTRYEASLRGVGGSELGYTWSIVEGSLPPGLTLDSATPTATVRGTPTAAGTFPLTIRLEDSAGESATGELRVIVLPAVTIVTTSIANGMEGAPYSQTIVAQDGARSGYSWSVITGSLPAGLTLTSGTPSATLAGTPTENGSFDFTVQVTDGLGTSATQALSLILDPNLPLEITSIVLPDGDENQAYSGAISAQGGLSPRTISLAAGALPTGMSLAADGTLSGTPSVSGGFFLRVQVEDAAMNRVTKDFLLTVFAIQRSIAFRTDSVMNNQNEVRTVDITGPTLGAPSSVRSPWPANADAASSSTTHLSPDGRFLAFLADLDTDNADDLHVVDLSLAQPTAVALTSMPAGRDVENLRWAPDARKIAYVANPTTPNEDELYVVDISAGLGAPVTVRAHGTVTPGGDVLPGFASAAEGLYSWSWDSTRIHFLGNIETDTVVEAWTFDLNNQGAGAVKLHPDLVAGLGVDRLRRVGADAVALVGPLDAPGEGEAFLIDVSGATPGAPIQLNGPLPGFADVEPSSLKASVDETFLSYAVDASADGRNELFAVDLRSGLPAAGSAQRVSPAYTASESVADHGWSPGAQRLIYLADQNTNDVDELFLVDMSGSTPGAPTLVSGSPARPVLGAGWRPDGGGVTYLSLGFPLPDLELSWVDLSGTPAAPVTLNGAMPAGDLALEVEWLPDLSGLYYVGRQDSTSEREVFRVLLANPGNPTQMNGALLASGSSVGVLFDNAHLTRDGSRLFVRGDLFVDNDNEVAVIDTASPGSHTRANVVFTQANQDVHQLMVRPPSVEFILGGEPE